MSSPNKNYDEKKNEEEDRDDDDAVVVDNASMIVATASADELVNNVDDFNSNDKDLLLLTLKEYYEVCNEHHQHYVQELKFYEGKVLELDQLVHTSQIRLDQAKENIQHYEHKKRSQKMEAIQNQINRTREEFLELGPVAAAPPEPQPKPQEEQGNVVTKSAPPTSSYDAVGSTLSKEDGHVEVVPKDDKSNAANVQESPALGAAKQEEEEVEEELPVEGDTAEELERMMKEMANVSPLKGGRTEPGSGGGDRPVLYVEPLSSKQGLRTQSKGDLEPVTTNHSIPQSSTTRKLTMTPPRPEHKKSKVTTPSSAPPHAGTTSLRQSKLPQYSPSRPKVVPSKSISDTGSRTTASSSFLRRLQDSRARSSSPAPNRKTPAKALSDRAGLRGRRPKTTTALGNDNRRVSRSPKSTNSTPTQPPRRPRAQSDDSVPFWAQKSPTQSPFPVSGKDGTSTMISTIMEPSAVSAWLRMLSKATHFHRIRQFIPKSLRAHNDVDCGRQAALWCFVNGLVMHQDIHEQLYQKFYSSSTNAMGVTRFFDKSRCPPPVNKITQAKWDSTWEFCKIVAGDIVCLMLPNRDPQESLCIFGAVQDHKVIFEKQCNLEIDWNKKRKQEMEIQLSASFRSNGAGHSALNLNQIDLPSSASIGEYVCLRKVRWYRIAKTRDLPGQTHGTKRNYVDWLMENHPKHIMNITGRGARDYLQSEEFLDICCSTTNIQRLLHLNEEDEDNNRLVVDQLSLPTLPVPSPSIVAARSPVRRKHEEQDENDVVPSHEFV